MVYGSENVIDIVNCW